MICCQDRWRQIQSAFKGIWRSTAQKNSGKSWKAILEWTAITRGWWFPHTLPSANHPLFACHWFREFFCFRWSQSSGEIALTYFCLSLPPYFFRPHPLLWMNSLSKWVLPVFLPATQWGLLSGQDNSRVLNLLIQWILHLISQSMIDITHERNDQNFSRTDCCFCCSW